MQDEARENEPVASESERKGPDLHLKYIIWFIRLAAASYIAGMLWTIWQEDEVRLHVLHTWIRALQSMARTLGIWAIQAEAAYNEVADLLH